MGSRDGSEVRVAGVEGARERSRRSQVRVTQSPVASKTDFLSEMGSQWRVLS